ncbi:MAG: pyruvate dehydrogenase (acetyl-transferring) E1 component subunit alpha [Deltaproteobacteria bacterium RBG_16_71_12]|nr:MAG: pyruvate dehydrogenase (acetyl-transferring) E1 component subunit alpha [Deltaproteobacteria bacterium RBG_16_71_12]
MLLIRRFEERCIELYGAGKIRGFMHLYDGEEAVAVGVMRALEHHDAVVATYREHGQALARGLPPGEVMAELFGKREGSSGGRGGSMHVFDAQRRFYGGNAIVGGGIPIAVGLALADQMLGRPSVTACFFGEGAVAEGEFHESLNLASLWRLPVVFVCENNRWAMGSALDIDEAETDVATKARGYRMAAERVDGMDVVAVAEAAQRAVAIARKGAPCLLEMHTCRFRAHSMFDAQGYRDKAEVERWRERDPLLVLARAGKSHGLFDDDALHAAEQHVRGVIDDAVAFAERGTWEPVEELERHVTAPRPDRRRA